MAEQKKTTSSESYPGCQSAQRLITTSSYASRRLCILTNERLSCTMSQVAVRYSRAQCDEGVVLPYFWGWCHVPHCSVLSSRLCHYNKQELSSCTMHVRQSECAFRGVISISCGAFLSVVFDRIHLTLNKVIVESFRGVYFLYMSPICTIHSASASVHWTYKLCHIALLEELWIRWYTYKNNGTSVVLSKKLYVIAENYRR